MPPVELMLGKSYPTGDVDDAIHDVKKLKAQDFWVDFANAGMTVQNLPFALPFPPKSLKSPLSYHQWTKDTNDAIIVQALVECPGDRLALKCHRRGKNHQFI